VTFLLTDYDNTETQGWFGYNINKLVSISAAIMSVRLSKLLNYDVVFDSRAFNVPANDVVNCFLWRAQDWTRNSVQMFAQSMFSHKELHKKSVKDLLVMTYQRGFNWNTLEDRTKNGTFITRECREFVRHSEVLPFYSEIANLLNQYINISLDKV
jgi:tRNA(His) guanylyltransferase